MIRKMSMFLALVLLTFSTSACQTNGWGDKQTGGMLLGAGLGGLLGSQVGSGEGQLAAVAIGVLGGAIVGGEVGRSMDHQQRQTVYGYPPVAYPQMYPYTGYSFGGYAQCGSRMTQARADCIRGLADANARRDALETRWQRY